jgi:hypothetical protein
VIISQCDIIISEGLSSWICLGGTCLKMEKISIMHELARSRRLVNTKFLILYFGQKIGLKCNKSNINKVCSFRST